MNNCPFCGEQNYWLIPFNQSGAAQADAFAKGYHWRLCKLCGNAYPSHPPELKQLQVFWDANRIEINSDANAEEIWRSRLRKEAVWAQRAYDFISPFLANRAGRFLDVACGLGATVEYFQNKGWIAEGVDADPSTAQHHSKLAIKTTIGQIENIETETGFDLISISHAIYFISDPLAFLDRVKTLLNQEGYLLIILSDFLSNLSDGQPGFAHTCYPSPSAMIHTLCQNGFQFVSQKKIRGSILILVRASGVCVSPPPKNFPTLIYAQHITQRLRYNTIGRPILSMARVIRTIRNAFTF
jgi:SAM-dependent methyltransferase